MRFLSAILLSGLFAGIAAAPAASLERAPDVAGTVGDGAAPARDDGSQESPFPGHDAPRLAATPAPVLKGPDERERGGPRPDPGPHRAGPRSHHLFPAGPARVRDAGVDRPAGGESRSRTECRAGRRPLPPPVPSRA